MFGAMAVGRPTGGIFQKRVMASSPPVAASLPSGEKANASESKLSIVMMLPAGATAGARLMSSPVPSL